MEHFQKKEHLKSVSGSGVHAILIAKNLLVLVTQRLELFLALMLCDLATTFFLQVTHDNILTFGLKP